MLTSSALVLLMTAPGLAMFYGGLLEGNIQQVVGIVAAIALAIVGTVIILKIVDALLGLRVNQAGELQGLDLNQHDEEGYVFL